MIYRPIILKPREKYNSTVEKILSVKTSSRMQPKRQSDPAAMKIPPRFLFERFPHQFIRLSITAPPCKNYGRYDSISALAAVLASSSSINITTSSPV